jgi:hypothetical protein
VVKTCACSVVVTFQVSSGFLYVAVAYAVREFDKWALLMRNIILKLPAIAVTSVPGDLKAPIHAAADKIRDEMLRQLGGATLAAIDTPFCAKCERAIDKAVADHRFETPFDGPAGVA